MADKSRKPGSGKPGAPADKDTAREKQAKAERNNVDPNYKPGPDDAQIDAGGARFETDG